VSRLTLSIRGALALTCLLVPLALPLSAGAQGIPTVDEKMIGAGAVNLTQRIADWYLQARTMRETMLERGRTAVQRTERLVSTRQRYERQAVGELGKLGEFVPDWREMGNFCAVAQEGHSVCTVNSSMLRRFERAIGRVESEFREHVFTARDQVDRSLESFIGAQFSRGITAVLSETEGTPDESRAQSYRFMKAQAERADDLDTIAAEINDLVDRYMAEQIDDAEMSSGRAKQITTYLTYAEARVELEITRSVLGALELNSASAADQVLDDRRAAWARVRVSGW
jgi:hypothetical protein